MTTIKTPKKLIEVALPLDAINVAAVREKSIRHGHPSTLHLWWARRPLAAARAVIFAQMVNDPGYERGLGRGVNKERAKIQRERLFEIMRRLVEWENTNDASVIAEARAEIMNSWRETCELNRSHPRASEIFNPDELPGFHDPFAGGGAIPLEAQRLGLRSHATDLNPVAVVINKAMIEMPALFAGMAPIGPLHKSDQQVSLTIDWSGARGLAEDVRRYGLWMRDEAFRRIGHLYPKVEVPENLGGGDATVIAWIWARTVKSPNPAFSHVEVPLISTYILSSKAGREAYVRPVVSGDSYSFEVVLGIATDEARAGTKSGGRGANFICIVSGTPISGDYIKAEGVAGRMGSRLLAVVADGPRGRLFLAPSVEMETVARLAVPQWKPGGEVPARLTGGTCVPYGMKEWGDLFTSRQLVALNTFVDVVQEARTKIRADAIQGGRIDDGKCLNDGGSGATAYADAISVYLAFLIDQVANHSSTICGWNHPNTQLRSVFSRQALPMTWDFAETNVFSTSSGSFNNLFERQIKGFEALGQKPPGVVMQADARSQTVSADKVISTDPPYYDNIAYADLSDFFYVWLRRSLRTVFPEIFSSMVVPKAEELVATAYRHGGKDSAEKFFLEGMTDAMGKLAAQAHPAFPVTIYYAFKQSDSTDVVGTNSTGWETFLEAVLRAGFVLTGTWPMRTEKEGRSIGNGANALASSIILVCRKRAEDAPTVGRREFLRELNSILPDALLDMTRGGVNSPVAPVDLSQAIIGPGMAIFSQYAAVLEADGKPMNVRTALQLINRFFAEDDFDHDTQFCLHWFEGQGWAEGKFGEADVLARAKGTSVAGLQDSGVVESGAGKLRLLRWAELPKDWSPEGDNRTPVWEALHQLIRALNQDGESAAGALLARMPARAEPMRALAYRLYTLCERKGWAEEARGYNELVTAWSSIEQASADAGILGSQTKLDI